MILDSEEQGELNLLVVQYLGQVNSKLRDKFCKAANITPGSESGQSSSLTLESLVQSYEDSKKVHSGKRKGLEEEESEQSEKKQKLEEKESEKKIESKKKKEVRKTVFIRNIGKKFNFEKNRGRFEAFGETLGFTNSGKGFGFLTFVTEEAANTCIETLNSTEIDGQVLQMNIARGNQGKGDDETTSCRLFVHGVKQEVTQIEIDKEFSKFGPVIDCFNPGKGFIFVTYQTQEQAEAAVDGLQGKKLFGNVLSLNISKPKEKPEVKKDAKKNKKKKKDKVESTQSRLFVKNIAKDADMEDIKKIFAAHGAVQDIYNPGKGFIFVSYSNNVEAESAIKALDGEHVNGQIIECNIAQFKKGAKKKK